MSQQPVKDIIGRLNKAFESRIRLGVMSVLVVADWVSFNDLKGSLRATDGNLASHLVALEKKAFVEVRKRFVGRRPNTTYRATAAGRQAFRDHLDALESLLRNQHPNA